MTTFFDECYKTFNKIPKSLISEELSMLENKVESKYISGRNENLYIKFIRNISIMRKILNSRSNHATPNNVKYIKELFMEIKNLSEEFD